MRIKKAFWASLALVPASIVPLSTATSCSQAWGYKTPLSIGSSTIVGHNNPFYNFLDEEEFADMVDLGGQIILDKLQSNFAIDNRSNNYYGYSLPEKWNAEAEGKEEGTDVKIKWDKGAFEQGSAGWYSYSANEFVKSANKTGTRTIGSKTDKVGETVYSYINNTLSSVIQLIGTIGTSISSVLNYALQYQGAQIGTEYNQAKDSDLSVSWGGDLTHGAKDSVENRAFYESIFAANAVSGTSKAQAALHPTHVQFNFAANSFPIVAYKKTNNDISGVHDVTLKLLNGKAQRPRVAPISYYSNITDELTEKIYDIRTDKNNEFKYKVYTYTNVPVIVNFKALTRSFVNPTKNDSYIVSDYYPETKVITDTIGDNWKSSLPKFSTYKQDYAKPIYDSYTFTSLDEGTRKIEPKVKSSSQTDTRLDSYFMQNTFVVLMNYAYKEYQSGTVNGQSLSYDDVAKYDRVTMTGITSIFPGYLLDNSLDLGEETFFKVVSNDSKISNKGYIIDSDKVNKYNNLLFELLKRSSGQGLVTHAAQLNKTSKELLKVLGFMFGNSSLAVDTKNIIHPTSMPEQE